MRPNNGSTNPHPRLEKWLARPSPPVWLGVVVAAILIFAEAVIVRLLEGISNDMIFGAVFLLGVLIISAGWEAGLAVATTFASAAVYLYMHLGGPGDLLPFAPHDAISLAVFLPIALLANLLVGQARQRAAEARRAAVRISELAQRQAALRRVATLVAQGISPSEVLTAVVDEVARTLGTGNAALFHFLDDETVELVAAHSDPGIAFMPVGSRFPMEGENVAVMVKRTGRTARIDSYEAASGPVAESIRELGLHCRVGAPITVDGRLWGAAIVGSAGAEPLPPDTEGRLADFAELVGTAIANADARAELMASRARIVAAGDEVRRRIERDLHDGAQQRLVALALQLRTLQATLPAESTAAQQISNIAAGLSSASEELRQIARGIHPTVLSVGGLRPALRALGRRAAIPVTLTINVERRLPESVEVAAYYVVAEALTNATKYANASLVTVTAEADDDGLRLSVSDDGAGGAVVGGGSGLVGLKDRVEALGGHLRITSVEQLGTTLIAEIPYPATTPNYAIA
ncbi:signal transduction histidine kinase [Mycobacterium sp. MAA66]|uniref:GAF domain-containing sensor histidine kinase n=1 Tax=Mycobacterium sp. MAA66 TaxID=3156297 RepID=UPI0035139A7B